jgi:hypothetical protein
VWTVVGFSWEVCTGVTRSLQMSLGVFLLVCFSRSVSLGLDSCWIVLAGVSVSLGVFVSLGLYWCGLLLGSLGSSLLVCFSLSLSTGVGLCW